MAILNPAVVNGAQAVARALAVEARQAATGSLSSAISSITNTPPPVTSTAVPTPDTTSPPQTTSTGQPGGGGGGGGTSSPLLFFVALGFGVVFTNLWIIVGVKYCFRYNARNRQMRGAVDENGDPINLENMPARPHRRRREKKLMTMDEVNDKFPMMKYKSWVADRAKEGLPTAGGVSVPPSRANSLRNADGIIPDIAPKDHMSTNDERPATSTASHSTENATGEPKVEKKEAAEMTTADGGAESGAALTQTQTVTSEVTKDPDHNHGSDDEDDDEHINAALPPELLTTAGDTCAICIDSLEDDDDVRGLTCGHAFHAVCLDPWLTNRRACCPLCKADYYTPKPRPPPADGSDPATTATANPVDPARNNGRLNLPLTPQRTFGGWSLRPGNRAAAQGSTENGTQVASEGNQQRRRRQDRRPAQPLSPNATSDEQQQQGAFSRFRSRFAPFRATPTPAVGTDAPEQTTTGATTTPSQLEAGTRS